MAREGFRIVRNETPARDDFLTARELGKPLRDHSRRREWAEAVSVYEDVDYAVRQARRIRFGLGRFVVRLTIPDGAAVELVQTGGDSRHFSLFARPEQLLAWSDDRALDAST